MIEDTLKTNGVQTLSPGGSVTLEAETRRADTIQVFIDDGTGSAPSSYDFSVEVYSENQEIWHPVTSATGQTSQRQTPETIPPKARITVTRPSSASSSADYRVYVVTYSS
jgi:hypothetical protein